MRNMLAMYCEVAHDDWAQLLPFVQMTHNTAYGSTILETPHYLMFGRMPTLPIYVLMGMPQQTCLIQHYSTLTRSSRICSLHMN